MLFVYLFKCFVVLVLILAELWCRSFSCLAQILTIIHYLTYMQSLFCFLFVFFSGGGARAQVESSCIDETCSDFSRDNHIRLQCRICFRVSEEFVVMTVYLSQRYKLGVSKYLRTQTRSHKS